MRSNAKARNNMNTKHAVLDPQSFKLDGGAMFGIIPKPLWNKVHPADQENRIELALRLLLIIKNERIILIDTGIGNYHGDRFDQRFAVTNIENPLDKSLENIGLKREDITDLVISHLHFDHIGGIVEKISTDDSLQIIFKNATLHLHSEHYNYAQNPTERDAGSFHQNIFNPAINWYKEHQKIHWLTGSEGEILPGLKFLVSHGHTPYLLHAYDEKTIYLADLIPTNNHIHIPWVMGYDIAPGITTADKRRILKFIVENNLIAIFEHDPEFLGARVIQNEKNEFVCGEKFKSAKHLADWLQI